MDADRKSIQFDAAALTPLARKASGRENLCLNDWQVEPVKGGMDQGSSIKRIFGVGLADGQPVPWSLILKTAAAAGAGNLANQ
jgi:hypothetical protein